MLSSGGDVLIDSKTARETILSVHSTDCSQRKAPVPPVLHPRRLKEDEDKDHRALMKEKKTFRHLSIPYFLQTHLLNTRLLIEG